MPGFNGTGPNGAGPMTGGARGLCNPASPGYSPGINRGYNYGRGFGYGRGFRGAGIGRGVGYGRNYGWYPPAATGGVTENRATEILNLKNEASSLQQSLEAIKQRIADMEAETSE